MQGKTHRMGGIAFTLMGFEYMRLNGYLLDDINYVLQLGVMYPISYWASTFPDLDHHWESVPNKTPINRIIHFLLHLTRPKHRSWQTHSILVTGGLMFLLYVLAFHSQLGEKGFSSHDIAIIQLLVMGFIMGLLSHLFLDFINPSGIHLIPNMKIKLVPKSKFFATGGTWETKIIYPLLVLVSYAMILRLIWVFVGQNII